MQVEDKIDPPEKKPIQLNEIIITPKKPSFAKAAGMILLATGARTGAAWAVTGADPEPVTKTILTIGTVLYSAYIIGNEIYKYNKAVVKSEKTVDDLKKESKLEPKKNQKENEFYSKKGGIKQAEKDFGDLGSSNVETKPNGTKVGRLPDGSTVNVRERSTDGRPTIEVTHPNNTKTKFRYDK